MRSNAAPRSSVKMLDSPIVEGDNSVSPKQNHMDSVVAGQLENTRINSGFEHGLQIKEGETAG